jgi:phage terminase large subunit
MPLPFAFDFKNPDYMQVFDWRVERLQRLRANPHELPLLKKYYKDNIAQFIIDWGCTVDPRNVEVGLPPVIPFMLFPRQEEWVEWFIEGWKMREPGLTAKSREMGISWVTVATACSLCLFYESVVGGFGSRKEEYVDKKGYPKSLFHKARQFISYLPKEFRGSWDERRDAPYMRISFPDTESILTGEAGDNIGRGDRTSFTIVDESAWLQHPELIDAALSQTTNCRVDVSTPRGPNNPFAYKFFAKSVRIFSYHWRDDPRKDDVWYEKQKRIIGDPVIIAQELDMDFNASVEGVLIPSAWCQALVDSHIKLGIRITGKKIGILDIADEGKDLNVFSVREGNVITFTQSWSGKNEDIYKTVERAFILCDLWNVSTFIYDADGLGAGARGDARVINEKRAQTDLPKIDAIPFRGSGAVSDPEKEVFPGKPGEPRERSVGRLNEDYFENFKAQSWFKLRRLVYNTYQAVIEKQEIDLEDTISISSSCPEYQRIIHELSQPTRGESKSGKMLINKKPDGALSPNHADNCMMAFATIKEKRSVWDV